MPVDPNQVIDDSATVAKAAASGGKAFWKSKRFWTNVVLVGGHYLGYLPANVAVYVGAAANIFLAAVSDKPLSLK
jgi:hypothetical protein